MGLKWQTQIRKLLYMCSWTAKRYNKTCKEMYERLHAKGKPERVIKVAIANKLLKQIFAVAGEFLCQISREVLLQPMLFRLTSAETRPYSGVQKNCVDRF